MNNLGWLYFEKKHNKGEALRLARQSFETSCDEDNSYLLALGLLWNDRYTEAARTFRQSLDFGLIEQHEKEMILFFLFLLAKKQHHLLLELFGDERYQLKERFKPVHCALMHRMRKEFPKESKKIGEELRETVEEILAEADRMAKEYP